MDRVIRSANTFENVRDEVIDGQLSAQVLLDKFGDLRSALVPAEGGPLPHASRHELEGPGRDLVARRGDANHAAHAPPAMGALKGGAHHLDIAGAIERVVGAPLGHLDNVLLHRLVELGAVHAICRPQSDRGLELGRVHVHGNDAARARDFRALDDRQAL
jgi:hypothetical protein